MTEKEEGLNGFMWHKSTTQVEEKSLLHNSNVGDFVQDKMLNDWKSMRE